MRRGVRPFVGLRPRRFVYLVALSVAMAVALPTLVSASGGYSVPGGVEHQKWGTAPAWAMMLSGTAGQQDAEVIVEFARGTKSQAMAHAAEKARAHLEKAHSVNSSNGIPFAVYSSSELTTSQLIAELKKQPGVVAVSVNKPLQLTGTSGDVPSDSSFGSQWALENTGQSGGVVDADIDVLTAWQRTVGSEDVVVAVIDSGVFYEHPDLMANMWVNPGEQGQPYDGYDNDGDGYADDLYGIDAINADSDPLDDCGHGTNVSGIIAAVGDNGIGTTGVAQRAKIMALKAFNRSGSGTVAAVIECINYAIDQKEQHGVNVVAINASFEAGGYDQGLRDAIQAAGDAGIVFVAAAGNSAVNVDSTPVYPASYDCGNIIAVGATDRYDARADFSNYGATGIDLFAPGVAVLNTVRPVLTAGTGTGTLFFDDMESGSGNWTPVAPSSDNPWAITTEADWTGTGGHAWSDSPNGSYAPGSRYALTSRTIDLSAASSSGSWLGFASLHQLGTGDHLIVKVSGDNGGTWTSVHLFAGTGEDYYWARLPQSAVTGTFKVQFVLESGSLPDGDYDGVYLDDVCITTKTPILYHEYYGTSMAAPHVTGTIALLAATAPASSMSDRIERVLSTTDALAALSGKCATGGRLNAGKAVISSAAPPAISEMQSRFGSSDGGTKVDVYGSNFYGVEFSGTSGVTFGGINALSYAIDSSEHIVAYAPPGSAGTTVQVQVHAACGDTPDTEADDFTYVPRPTITSVGPSTGPATGGVRVSITGTGFDEVSSVTFGGVQAEEWRVDSSTTLTVTVPAHAAGTVRVQITAAGGSTADTPEDDFTYVSTTAVQQTDTRLSFIGGWEQKNSNYASGGSYMTSDAAGSQLTVTFEGTYLALVAKTGPDGGRALVTVDGYEKGYADFYNASTRYQQVVFSTGTLECGAHTVVLRWAGVHAEQSTGTVINADAIQVLGEVTQAPVPVRHQQDSLELNYTGDWNSEWTWWLASECTQKFVNTPGASVNIEFNGTYMAWVGKMAPNHGLAQVSIDGGEPVTVDLYSPYTKYKQRIYDTGVLPGGEHTLSIYWLGAKNPASSNCYVSIDALDVMGEIIQTDEAAEPITWAYEQSDSRITYVGQWNTRWDGRASAWSFLYSTSPGAGAIVSFEGGAVQVMGKTGPPYGEVAISLDGGEPELVDLYSEQDVFRTVIYAKQGLSDGPHTLVIEATDNKNEDAVMAAINIDGLKVDGYLTQAPKITRYEQDCADIDYQGSWTKNVYSPYAASGWSYGYTDQADSSLNVGFEGTYLEWNTRVTPWSGIARVVLDEGTPDERVTMVDTWHWTDLHKQPVYNTGLLTDGPHTLSIYCTGDMNADSWYHRVYTDAFDVIGELKPSTF